MKITASKRDDILQRKADYEAKVARNTAIEEEQYGRFRKAQEDVFANVEKSIREKLGDKIGELVIRVETRFGHGLTVEIGNDKGGPRRSANASLTWNWRATLDDEGNVTKESSSWSGLEAVTMEQVADLKLCVEQLEIINTMDWKKLLDVTLPRWKDYIDTSVLEDVGPKPDFDRELFDVEMEEAVGANILIKAHTGRNYRGDVYFNILRDSGSQYTVIEIPSHLVDAIQQGKTIPVGYPKGGQLTTFAELVDYFKENTIRIRKTNMMHDIYKPIVSIAY